MSWWTELLPAAPAPKPYRPTADEILLAKLIDDWGGRFAIFAVSDAHLANPTGPRAVCYRQPEGRS
jgi:hypothetical protein